MALQIRTTAGPSSVVRWVLSGGPYTVLSQAPATVHVFAQLNGSGNFRT